MARVPLTRRWRSLARTTARARSVASGAGEFVCWRTTLTGSMAAETMCLNERQTRQVESRTDLRRRRARLEGSNRTMDQNVCTCAPAAARDTVYTQPKANPQPAHNLHMTGTTGVAPRAAGSNEIWKIKAPAPPLRPAGCREAFLTELCTVCTT